MQAIATAAAVATVAYAAYHLHKRKKLPPPGPPQPPLDGNVSKIRRLLQVIEKEILPKTSVQVAAGNKVFGKRCMIHAFHLQFLRT